MNHHNYTIGDTLTYQTFGGGEVRTVTVTGRDPELKNGAPGFFGTMANGATVWGYDDQIISVGD